MDVVSRNVNIFCKMNRVAYRGKDSIIGNTVRIRRPELFVIGRNSIVDDFAYLSCRIEIGSFSHIGAHSCMIGGAKTGVKIGNFVNIAPGCSIAAGQNNYYGGGLCGPAIPEGYGSKPILGAVEIGDHCLIGFGVSILAGVYLPEGVAVGAHSLLKPMNYKPWTVYAGVTCKEIGKRDGQMMKAQAELLMQDVKDGKL